MFLKLLSWAFEWNFTIDQAAPEQLSIPLNELPQTEMTEFTCSPLLPRPHQQPPKGCQGCRICTASAEIVKPAYYRPDQPRAHLEPKETTTTKMCDIMAFSGLEIRLSHNSLPNREVGCFFQIMNHSQIFGFFRSFKYILEIVLMPSGSCRRKQPFNFFRIRELLKLRLSHNSLPNQEVGCFLQILNLS